MKQHITYTQLINNVNASQVGKEALILLDESMAIVTYNNQVNSILPTLTEGEIGQNFNIFWKNCAYIYSNNNESSPLEYEIRDNVLSEGSVIGFRQSDSTIKWTQISITYIPTDVEIIYTLLSFYEITTLYNKQLAIEKEVSNMDTLISSIDDIIFEVSREGIVLNGWTSVPEQLFLPKDQMVGKSVKELFPEDYAHALLTIIHDTLYKKRIQQMEYQSPFKPNDGKWFRLQAKPIPKWPNQVTVVISNISEEVEIKSQALLEEQKFNRAFQHSSMGMLLVDANGIIMECNSQFAQIIGYDDTSAIVKRSFLEFTLPADSEKSLLLLQDFNNGKIEKAVLEKRYLHQDNSIIHCLLTISAIHKTDKLPSFYLAQVQDLSLFKQNEQLLITKQSELERSNLNLKTRLNQLEALYQVIAHNLRTPASNIEMITQQLKKHKNQREDKLLLSLLEQSSARLFIVLEDLASLLEQYSDEDIGFEACNIKDITLEILDAMEAKMEPPHHSQIMFKLKQPTILFPKVYLQSILFHLFNFSMEHISSVDRLSVKIITWKKNNFTYLRFLDNTARNPEKKQDSILTKALLAMQPHSDGQNIGFFMTKFHLESLGGTMRLEPYALGIKFTICFPNTPSYYTPPS